MSMEAVSASNYGTWNPLTKRIEAFATEKVIPTLPNANNYNIPLNLFEHFVTENDSKTIVRTIFIVAGAMLVAALIGMAFYWSYQKDTSLFITVLCAITLIYGVMNIILLSLNTKLFSANIFETYLGASILVTILNLLLIMYFGYKAKSRLGEGAGGDRYSNSGYTPQPVYSSGDI